MSNVMMNLQALCATDIICNGQHRGDIVATYLTTEPKLL